jgi:fatty acid desaturase
MKSPPRPPDHFLSPQTHETVAYALYALSLAFLPGVTSAALVLSEVSPFVTVPLCLVLIGVAGFGFFMLAGTGHEGFHLNLHRRPVISALIGSALSSAVPGFMAVGFAASHWRHHRYTNEEDDPDCAMFSRFASLWSRAFLARLVANAGYRKATLQLIRGVQIDGMQFGAFSFATFRRIAYFNIAAQVTWQSAFVVITLSWPLVALFAIWLPLLATVVITGLNPYQEHAETGREAWRCARSRTSWIYTMLMLGTNYHLEHHLYARVPCWRLPSLHQWLWTSQWYSAHQPIVESSFLRSFSPKVLGKDAKYGVSAPMRDPLRHAN